MRVLGIDVGSLNTKLVILEDGNVIYRRITSMAEGGDIVAQKAIEEALREGEFTDDEIDSIAVTSHIKLKGRFAGHSKNFFVCLARGAVSLVPEARTIIDVGAENVMVASLDNRSRIRNFVQNDRCAAGSGVFLEAITKMMGLSMEEMISEAMKADKGVPIASTCTIFAEQEVLSAVFEASPPSRSQVLAGVHDALASRVVGLAIRAGIVPPIFLCGGVVNNRAFIRSFKEQIKKEVILSPFPQFVPALGAALSIS